MELIKKHPALLYLEKNGFYFFEEGLTSVISLAFSETAIRDMEVINTAQLMTQIKTFIDQYQLTPAIITIVLSPNVVFEKDITGLARDTQEEMVKSFIDTIPFESVLTKSFPIDKGVKVIGFNDDLYMELKNSFEKNQFIIENILPYQLLGADQVLIKNLTADNASQFIKRSYHLKQYTLTTVEKEKTATVSQQPTTSAEKPKKTNIRLFAMIGIFAVLFGVLGYMLFTMK